MKDRNTDIKILTIHIKNIHGIRAKASPQESRSTLRGLSQRDHRPHKDLENQAQVRSHTDTHTSMSFCISTVHLKQPHFICSDVCGHPMHSEAIQTGVLLMTPV